MLDFSKVSRVLVVGDFMVDVNHMCVQSRVNNEGGYSLLQENSHHVLPGGAGNVAHALLRLGVSVRLLSVVGGDTGATSALQVLHAFGSMFESDVVYLPHKVSLRRDRYYVGDRCVFRSDVDSILGDDYRIPWYMTPAWIAAMDDCSAVLVVDHGKGLLTRDNKEALSRAANLVGARVYLDSTDWPPAPGYIDLTLVKTGFKADPSFGSEKTIASHSSLADDVSDWMAENNVDFGIVTGSSQLIGVAGDSTHCMRFQRVNVVDPVGAGDQFMAVAVAGMEQLAATRIEDPTTAKDVVTEVFDDSSHPSFGKVFGKSSHRTMEMAATAARMVVQRPTALPVSFAELQSRATNTYHDIAMVNWPADRELVALACRTEINDAPVALINGCFDLFHAGHYNVFTEASNINTRVVVAVNTDESVTALKGAGRPIVPLAQRMSLLSSQANVFLVIPFNGEEELRDIIRVVSPRYLVKGSDYFGKRVVGDDQEGCEVVYADTAEPEVSTTMLIERAKNST